MEIAFGCKQADDDTETNPVSLEKLAKEIYGKSKRKTLSFRFSRHASTSTEHSQLKIFLLYSSDKERSRTEACENVGGTREKSEHKHASSSAVSHAKPSIVGLFTQHRTFTFSQQLSEHQN